jgi:PAS domain S-box-containing protein
MRAQTRIGLSRWLTILVIGATAPLLLFAGVTLFKISNDARVARDRGQVETARALALGIDGEVRSWKAALTSLAASDSLRPDRLAQFYDEARRVAGLHGGSIVLTAESGQQLINTLHPYGAPLPETSTPVLLRAIFQDGKPMVTNVFFEKLSDRYIVTVAVPVVRAGAVRYMLDLSFEPQRLSPLLEREPLSPAWTAAINDQAGRVIARSQEIERQGGRPAFAWLVAAIRAAERGIATGPLTDWSLGQVAFERMQEAPWTAIVSIPMTELDTEKRVARFVLAGALLFLFSVGAAVVVGNRIARPVSRLVQASEQMMRGHIPDIGPPSAIREVRELQQALVDASIGMQGYYQERERAAVAEQTAQVAKAAEQALRRYHLLAANARDVVLFLDHETGRILEANRAAVREYGYAEEELKQLTIRDLQAPAARSLAGAQISPMDAEGVLFETVHQRKDGSTFPVEVSSRGETVDDRRMLLNIVRDITARKQALEELRASQERLAAVLGSAMDAIISLDEDQRVILFNASAEQMFCCSASDAIGKPLDRFIPERFRQAHRHHIKNYGATGVSARSMYSPASLFGLRASGEEFPLEATISQANIGGRRLFTVIVRDVTQRKRAEELARLYAETKELERLKTEFVDNISHELRTPLTTIQEGVSQVTEGILGPTTPEQREFLSIVLSDIERLSRLINDLLDIAKVEAGRLELACERVNIVALARHAALLFEPMARAKGLRIRTHFPTAGIEVYVDRDKIAQVFANLLANALKFTEDGEVTLTVTDMGERVACTVTDTGRGIALDQLPKIFQRFYQANRTPGPGERGTGLGLPIAKAIVEGHGGEISASSTPGAGCTFTFTLPKTLV